MLSTQASHIYFRFVVVNRPWFAFFVAKDDLVWYDWFYLANTVGFSRFALWWSFLLLTSVAHTQLLLGLIKNVALVVALATYLVTRGSRARIDKD